MKHLIIFILLIPATAWAQKKPLDHTVYDGWQSIGERAISNDGKWVVYSVTPQEGDATLWLQSTPQLQNRRDFARGYNAAFTEDNRYLIFKIRPLYKDTRDARIKKKKPEDLPKDSIGMVELATGKLIKVSGIKSFKTPEKGSGWLAYLKEKQGSGKNGGAGNNKSVDSLRKTIDSLNLLIMQLKNQKSGNRDELDADDEPSGSATVGEGSELVLRNLQEGKDRSFKNVVDYLFDQHGTKLLMRVGLPVKDSFFSKAVVVYDLKTLRLDTILKGGNDFKGFAFSEDGQKIAFVADRDSSKSLQKFYGLYLYRNGDDTAYRLIDRNSAGMDVGMTVSEFSNLTFSHLGDRLFFGTAPIQPPKDTTLVDIDQVKVDIWNYQDDYLQSQQLYQLNNELKRNYSAVYDFNYSLMRQLGNPGLTNVMQSNEGDGNWFYAYTDTGRRIESQWKGGTRKDFYAIDMQTGEKQLIKKNHDGQNYVSSTGKYLLLYDNRLKHYFCWDGKSLKNITSKIKIPLYNEEHDTPDDPNPYGILGWHQGDSAVYIYDRYNIWMVDPAGKKDPEVLMLKLADGISYRYIKVNEDEKFVRPGQTLYFRVFDRKTKRTGIATYTLEPVGSSKLKDAAGIEFIIGIDNFAYSTFIKAKDRDAYVFSSESYQQSPDLYFTSSDQQPSQTISGWHAGGWKADKISSLNPQQSQYNWGTAELYRWKAFNGKDATGILYKPEDFDSTKKYPVILYFYEKVSDGLHNYIAPAPTPSRLNISFFVSRGYLVLAPDISYTKGHPGKDAYNYIVSGAEALAKKKWVDSKNLAIQGQSWGGYQVAYLITATNLFKAAWAGAPVVNMFSAYGGIRWESGNNRQFQYEMGQSRIGATPWDRPDLYIENSPFFQLKKVKTPLVIMSNDADGAVPWYQGIEFFTAMRRLGKPVWLLNYNGEAHNLVERRNRKDIQIREQQYFDWLLKGAPAPKWITEGVPAVRKGKDWGLGY